MLGANDNMEILELAAPKWIDGVVLSGTVGGTWTVIVKKR